MAKKERPVTKSQAIAIRGPQSLEIVRKGITDPQDLVNLASALIEDLLEEKITPQLGYATTKAIATLILTCEFALKNTPQPIATGFLGKSENEN